MILSMKLSSCFTLRGKPNFQVSTRKSSKSATSAVEVCFSLASGVFLWHPDAGLGLIFFRKYFFEFFTS